MNEIQTNYIISHQFDRLVVLNTHKCRYKYSNKCLLGYKQKVLRYTLQHWRWII